MKKYRNILLTILAFMPTLVYASSGSFDIFGAILMEAFITIHMSLFFLAPITNVFSKEENFKKNFFRLFCARIAFLLFCDIFISPDIAIVDFIFLFIGAFIIVPVSSLIKRKSAWNYSFKKTSTPTVSVSKTEEYTCANCKTHVEKEDLFCPNCGMPLKGNKIAEETSPVVNSFDFDPIYFESEDKMLEEFLKREMDKAKIDMNESMIPEKVKKRKSIMFIILSLLTFILISLIFFHVNIIYILIGLITMLILFKKSSSYNLISFLKKEVKSRPEEEISNIVMNVKLSFVKDTTKRVILIGVLVSIALSSVLYMKPHILYEPLNEGYAVRFYTVGLTNFKNVKIPEKHNGSYVVGIRGQVFKNMYFLKSVELPNSITEIRGQAFENDYSLEKINIPENLTYLGGSAFKKCKSLKNVYLPDTLTYIGGEAFKDATKLESINLPKNLKEIRGNTFENDASLKEISIPDTVTRIGGHAFYGCKKLSKVEINEHSELNEIGSSAFRLCTSLEEITIPSSTSVNSRAFKESPTKVKKYGELDYGSLIQTNNYKKKSFEYIRVGETIKISPNENSKTSLIASEIDAQITLKSINITANGNEFILEYEDSTSTKEFKLNKSNAYYKPNSNIAIEVSASYVFNSSSSISLNTYYN